MTRSAVADPKQARRSLLRGALVATVGLLTVFWQRGSLAVTRNNRGFEARSVDDVLASLGAKLAAADAKIIVRAPDVAADGGAVDVVVKSLLPDTRSIAILVDGNIEPLAIIANFKPGIEPMLSVTVRMRKTSRVTAVVTVGEATHMNWREVKVARATPTCSR
jgi:predicted secreted protein